MRSKSFALGAVLLMCMTALGGLTIVGSDQSDAADVSYTVRTGDWMMTEMDESAFDMSTSASIYLSGLSSQYYYAELDPPGINAYFYADCPTGTYSGSWFAVNDESGEETFYERITVTVVAGGPYRTGITHLVMGASNVPESQVVQNYDTNPQTFTISSAIPTKSGMAFLGYSTSYSSSEVVYQPGDSVTVRAGTTVYLVPVFGTLYSHTVEYDANGGAGSTESTVVSDSNNGNTNVTLASCGFTKTGYTFAGWKIGNTTYQPGQTVPVGANATVTATAQWSQNTLTATANNISGVSGQAYSNQIGASANNGGTVSYAVKSCTGGNATVNSNGLVTYTAPSVSSTTSFTVTVTVTGTFAQGGNLTRDVSFTVTVDPVLSFTNAATSGTLSVKGA